MIPILEPAQFPAIFFNGVLITGMVGIPTALFALAIFFMLERVPSRGVRFLLPVACAVLMVVISMSNKKGGFPLPPLPGTHLSAFTGIRSRTSQPIVGASTVVPVFQRLNQLTASVHTCKCLT